NASNGWFDWAAFAVVQSMLWLLAAAGLWMRARRMPFEVRRCEETRSELESLFYMAQEQLPLEGMTYLGYLALLKQGAALVGGAGSENLFTVHLLIQPERIYLHSILTGEERRADFSLARFLLLCLRRPEFRYGPPEVVLALSPRERDRYASELHRAGFVAVAGGELGAGGVYREQLRNLPAQRFGQWRPFQKEIVFFQFRPETALQAMN
ncbi:MAG: hypothetical protein K1X75_18260, partial [Leptospirales bacterium]|nr:hypothetical protein [Leptospirales bacterium]